MARGQRRPRVRNALFSFGVYSKESAVPFALLVLFIFHGCMSFAGAGALRFGAVPVDCSYLRGASPSGDRTLRPGSTDLRDLWTNSDRYVSRGHKYVRLLCGLPPFCIDYSYMERHYPFSSPEVLVGAVILFLFMGATVAALRRYKFWAVGFGFVWLGAFLTPVSNLVPMMQYMAERFLYLPLIGFLLALGALLLSASRSGLASALHPAIRPYLAQATVGIVVMIWASLSWNRSGIWRDKLTYSYAVACNIPEAGAWKITPSPRSSVCRT